MRDKGSIFGQKATAQIERTVREVLRRMMNSMWYRQSYHSDENRVQVKLQEDLLAAVDSWTDPSYATAKVFIKYNSTDDMRPHPTLPVITIVNRFENISVEAGTYCKAEWIDGEWQLYAADCPGTLSASSFAPSVSISPSVSTGGP